MPQSVKLTEIHKREIGIRFAEDERQLDFAKWAYVNPEPLKKMEYEILE